MAVSLFHPPSPKHVVTKAVMNSFVYWATFPFFGFVFFLGFVFALHYGFQAKVRLFKCVLYNDVTTIMMC